MSKKKKTGEYKALERRLKELGFTQRNKKRKPLMTLTEMTANFFATGDPEDDSRPDGLIDDERQFASLSSERRKEILAWAETRNQKPWAKLGPKQRMQRIAEYEQFKREMGKKIKNLIIK